LAFIIATLLAKRQAIKEGFSQDLVVDLAGYILVAGIIGARLLYVAINLKEYQKTPIEILMLQHGGLSFYGGALVAFLASIWFLKRHKVPFLKIADLLAPFLALGQSIGRLGCLLRGCCFGRIVQSGLRIKFPDEVVYRHPTQVYASIIDFLIFVLLKRLYRRRHPEGEIFLLFVILYSFKRFSLDFLRGDVAPIYSGLTVFQIISLFILIVSCSIFIFRRCKALKK